MDFYKALKLNRVIKNHRVKFLALALLHIFKQRHLVLNFDPALHCNLRCKMCHFSDPEQVKNLKGIFKKEEIDRIAELIFDRAIKLQIGCAAEPTIYKNFAEVIKLGKEHGVPHVSLTTNGNLLDEKSIREIVEAQLDEMILSVHGIKKETYEYFMDRASFEKFKEVIHTVDRIKKERNSILPKIRINYTVNKHNLEDLAHFFELFGDIDVETLQVRLIQNLGDTAYKDFSLNEKEDQLRDILWNLQSSCKEKGITFLVPDLNPISNKENKNLSSAIYEATGRYISPQVFWNKDFNWKNETYDEYCKRKGWTKFLLNNALKSKDKLQTFTRVLNYDVIS